MPEHPRWHVSVNNGQRTYIVEAPNAGDACVPAGDAWRADPSVTAKQRERGIYDIRAVKAKFSDEGFFIPLAHPEDLRLDRDP